MPEVEVCWYEDATWRGFLPISPRSELLRLHVFNAWVAGIHHYPVAADDQSFAPGEPLALVAEPDNPHDSDALGVWNADRTLKVGRMPGVIVDDLSPNERSAVCLSEQVEAGKRTNLRILLSREPVSLRPMPDERAGWRERRSLG